MKRFALLVFFHTNVCPDNTPHPLPPILKWGMLDHKGVFWNTFFLEGVPGCTNWILTIVVTGCNITKLKIVEGVWILSECALYTQKFTEGKRTIVTWWATGMYTATDKGPCWEHAHTQLFSVKCYKTHSKYFTDGLFLINFHKRFTLVWTHSLPEKQGGIIMTTFSIIFLRAG